MQVEKVKGLISLTFSLDEKEQENLYRMSEEELIQFSRGKAAGLINPILIREVAVGYDGKNIEVMLSL